TPWRAQYPNGLSAGVPCRGGLASAGPWPLAGGVPVLVACWAAKACCTACWMWASRSAGALVAWEAADAGASEAVRAASRCWRRVGTGTRCRSSGSGDGGRDGAAEWSQRRAVEYGQRPAVQLDRQRVLAELCAMHGVRAGALRRQGIGLLPTLHTGAAIRMQGDGADQHQREGLVQAVRQDLDA